MACSPLVPQDKWKKNTWDSDVITSTPYWWGNLEDTDICTTLIPKSFELKIHLYQYLHHRIHSNFFPFPVHDCSVMKYSSQDNMTKLVVWCSEMMLIQSGHSSWQLPFLHFKSVVQFTCNKSPLFFPPALA